MAHGLIFRWLTGASYLTSVCYSHPYSCWFTDHVLSGMQLHKLTGGKMIATNHRVNTLKIDADRFALIHWVSEVKISRLAYLQIHTWLCQIDKARQARHSAPSIR